MGARACRRYFLTAERFDVTEAHRLGLLHQVASSGTLAEAGERMLRLLLDGGPAAQLECKALIARVSDQPVDDAMVDDTAQRIARLRASPEGKEGVAAFLSKRKPDWVKA
jgi:methylglutaconyl-CoA hydratase